MVPRYRLPESLRVQLRLFFGCTLSICENLCFEFCFMRFCSVCFSSKEHTNTQDDELYICVRVRSLVLKEKKKLHEITAERRKRFANKETE